MTKLPFTLAFTGSIREARPVAKANVNNRLIHRIINAFVFSF